MLCQGSGIQRPQMVIDGGRNRILLALTSRCDDRAGKDEYLRFRPPHQSGDVYSCVRVVGSNPVRTNVFLFEKIMSVRYTSYFQM